MAEAKKEKNFQVKYGLRTGQTVVSIIEAKDLKQAEKDTMDELSDDHPEYWLVAWRDDNKVLRFAKTQVESFAVVELTDEQLKQMVDAMAGVVAEQNQPKK